MILWSYETTGLMAVPTALLTVWTITDLGEENSNENDRGPGDAGSWIWSIHVRSMCAPINTVILSELEI